MYSIPERLATQTSAIEGAMWQWLCALRCATVGKVISFDSTKQTCVIQPLLQEIVLNPPPSTQQFPNPGSTLNIPTTVTIAPIQDVPIMMMRVPGWSMTFPITSGTECLLIFIDSCIDGWWQNGPSNPQPPFDRRRHDLSDPIALFGPWSQKTLLTNYSTNSVQIRSDDKSEIIDLSSGQITVTAPAIQLLASGGTTQKLITDAFYQYWVSHILPFLQSVGYLGPLPPSNSETSIVEAQ